MRSWLSAQLDLVDPGNTAWVVVLEYSAGPGAERIGLECVRDLVDRLGEWRTSALYAPGRYALNMGIEASGATQALARALSHHGDAAGNRLPPGWDLAVVEIQTAQEFDRAVVGAARIDLADTSGIPLGGASEAVAVYEASQRIRLVTTRAEATAALADFVSTLGSGIEVRGNGNDDAAAVPDALLLDLSLGGPAPVFATAQPGSPTRLVLEFWLPTLIQAAHERLTCFVPEVTNFYAAGHDQVWPSEQVTAPDRGSVVSPN